MCTVSFVPIGPQQFILTSNRDETKQRGLASAPDYFLYNGTSILCPRDPLANGTWIAASENGRLTCLLNGAFKKHKHQKAYRKSRGIVVLDSLTYPSAEDFVLNYDFSGIEPFTMVCVSNLENLLLQEIRWDGDRYYLKSLDEKQYHLWSSVTLYNEEAMIAKELAFKIYFEQLKETSATALTAIHAKYLLYEDWVQSPARVPEVATLSVTSVSCNRENLAMSYFDLVRKELPVKKIALKLPARSS